MVFSVQQLLIEIGTEVITVMFILMVPMSDQEYFFRRFHGLFSTPVYLFPRKCFPAAPIDILNYTPMLKPGDQLSDQVVIRGTSYRAGFLVITKVFSDDVLQVGEILKVVVRKNRVHFLVTQSEAARNKLGFFESLPSDTVALSAYEALGDYKPIIKRADSTCYPFVLHHHVVPPPLGDGKCSMLTTFLDT